VKKRLKIAFQILAYSFRKAPFQTSILLITHVVLNFVPLAVAYAFKLLLNSYNTNLGNTQGFVILLTAYITLLGLQKFISIFRFIFSDSILRWKLQDATWYDFHQKLFNLDIGYFEDSDIVNAISKTRQHVVWRPVRLVIHLLNCVAFIVVAVFSAVIIFKYGSLIPLILVLSLLPKFLASLKYSEAQWSVLDSGSEPYKRLWYLAGLATDPESVKEIKIFGVSGELMKIISGIQKSFYDKNMHATIRYSLSNFVTICIQYGLTFFALTLYLFNKGQSPISVGELTFFLALIFAFSSNVNDTLDEAGFFMEETLYLEDFIKLLNLPPLIHSLQDPVIPNNQSGVPIIEFKNVSFKYKDSLPYVIKNVSLKIEHGENIALVGENGSGKSTLIKLLLRFYDVTEGEILVDGENIKNIKLDWWYSQVGALFQHFIRYNFTVKESIAFGDNNPDSQKLARAVELSGLTQLIENLPLKYDQHLGTQFYQGHDLSGGEWQKVALARAFYRMPKMLILDEPTSAIDANAEYEIFKNINNEYKDDKTLLIVSHRFSTVRMAERIIVLDKGAVEESGTHDQLLALKGLYAEMFLRQAEGYK